MPYWIDLVLDTDKDEPTYLQRASPSVIMEFRRWPDQPTPGPVLLPMKIIFKNDFVGKYDTNGANLTLGTVVGTAPNQTVEFLSQAGTSGGQAVHDIRIKLDPGSTHPQGGYSFDVEMQNDNTDWKKWDPRVVSK
jgi:hypothetical protein